MYFFFRGFSDLLTTIGRIIPEAFILRHRMTTVSQGVTEIKQILARALKESSSTQLYNSKPSQQYTRMKVGEL